MSNSEKLSLLLQHNEDVYLRIKKYCPHLIAEPEHAYPCEIQVYNSIVKNYIDNVEFRNKILL